MKLYFKVNGCKKMPAETRFFFKKCTVVGDDELFAVCINAFLSNLCLRIARIPQMKQLQLRALY